jgi:hypothetical protein
VGRKAHKEEIIVKLIRKKEVEGTEACQKGRRMRKEGVLGGKEGL